MWAIESYRALLKNMEAGPASVAEKLMRNAGQSWLPFYVRELAAVFNLSVEVETPFYLLQPVPMSDEFRTALRNVMLAAATWGISTSMVSAGAPRVAPRDTKRAIRLSFHSHGDEPNWWHVKDSHAPERFYFNRMGYSGWLKLSDAQRAYIDSDAEAPALDPALLAPALRSKYEQPDRAEPLPAGAMFFPMQLSDDTVAQHQRLDPLDVLDAAARAAAVASRPLLVKRHPRCKDEKIAAALAALEGAPFVHIVDAPVEHALDAAAVVLTGNSSVGFSALCAYKPVITFADSDYESCTYSVATLDQLEDALGKSEWYVDRGRCGRFLHVFFNELTFAIDDQAAWNKRVLATIAEAVTGFDAEEFGVIAKDASA